MINCTVTDSQKHTPAGKEVKCIYIQWTIYWPSKEEKTCYSVCVTLKASHWRGRLMLLLVWNVLSGQIQRDSKRICGCQGMKGELVPTVNRNRVSFGSTRDVLEFVVKVTHLECAKTQWKCTFKGRVFSWLQYSQSIQAALTDDQHLCGTRFMWCQVYVGAHKPQKWIPRKGFYKSEMEVLVCFSEALLPSPSLALHWVGGTRWLSGAPVLRAPVSPVSLCLPDLLTW